MYGAVKVWQETISLPTWTTGAEDPNPMFLENRVYQGSSGAVYPYGVIDTLTGKREIREYLAVWLENDFIRVMLPPELGGRIHRAWDKVMQRDFVYYNEVVKPALVGLVGPWMSAGIEFNWPQHHRPTTFMPVDVTFQQHDSGAQTVWLGEVEPMRGLQVMTGFTLYPEKALIEITGKVFNGNATPRHFLWWANPAVKGGDEHQSVFPPDVTAVFDHGKRDVSAFPIAQGTYYKVDYSAGVDISRYKNIPVPTSYMADKSDYDFVGAYHHGEQGGLLHIADHHVSPGKKQWTWGNCDFGLAWDRNLTDSNGPYIELMTGVFTDNQPDFIWIAPYEEKVFVQNFLPYSGLGTVQNANTQAAIKLERDGDALALGIYAIAPLADMTLVISDGDNPLWETSLSLAPAEVWQQRLEESWPLSYALHYARWAITGEEQDKLELLWVTGQRGTNASVLAGWLMSFGAEHAARELLEVLASKEAMPLLWQASLETDPQRQARYLSLAQQQFALRVRFPNTLDEVQMLMRLPQDGFAQYLLGCFWYSKRRYGEARACWEFCAREMPEFAAVQRVLAIHAWNKQQYARRAVELEPDNARFLFELDFLLKLNARPTAERLARLEAQRDVALKRDDLTAELLSLWH